MMNHVDTPFLFKIKDSKELECFEITSMDKPQIRRPKGDDGYELDAIETLGSCLGMCLYQSKMNGSDEKIEVELVKGEEDEMIYYPPLLFLMQLDGSVRYWKVCYGRWKDANLLTMPDILAAEQSK